VGGYFLFSHVQARVAAWQDPLSVIDDAGYQVSQSLFAIGTGGWFGLGLGQGLPEKIPVVTKDFIFAAISEEMGGIFALCLIMVCLSCFFMIMNVAMRLKDPFYRLSGVGLGTTYALQVFLTIGGVIKFIPSTGVTLPLVSYGGSSLLSTMIVFGIIQGLYIVEFNERLRLERKRQGGEAGGTET
jgi:cell division protein FtsW (lipid II flippase)